MSSRPPIRVSRRRWTPEIERVQAVVDRLLEGKPDLRILEAGCGSATHLVFPASASLVGIDIAPQQLDRNTHVDEKILGDVQSYPLEADSFDAVICWELLEHVPRPLAALDNLIRALRPGGLLILAFPNVLSFKGLVTKLSPHWFHIAYYRYVHGDRLAGVDGRAPFPTCLPLAMAPRRVCSFGQQRGLLVEYFDLYEARRQIRLRSRVWISGWRWGLARSLARAFSFGNVTLDGTECVVVLRRPEQASAQRAAS